MTSGQTAGEDGAHIGVDAGTFGSALGQAVWLMTMDKRYRDLPVHEIERIVATPILLRQFKIYSKGKQPVAFLSWAQVTDTGKARIEAGEPLELKDWRSGETVVVVDCVSPFNPREVFVESFLQTATDASKDTIQRGGAHSAD